MLVIGALQTAHTCWIILIVILLSVFIASLFSDIVEIMYAAGNRWLILIPSLKNDMYKSDKVKYMERS